MSAIFASCSTCFVLWMCEVQKVSQTMVFPFLLICTPCSPMYAMWGLYIKDANPRNQRRLAAAISSSALGSPEDDDHASGLADGTTVPTWRRGDAHAHEH